MPASGLRWCWVFQRYARSTFCFRYPVANLPHLKIPRIKCNFKYCTYRVILLHIPSLLFAQVASSCFVDSHFHLCPLSLLQHGLLPDSDLKVVQASRRRIHGKLTLVRPHLLVSLSPHLTHPSSSRPTSVVKTNRDEQSAAQYHPRRVAGILSFPPATLSDQPISILNHGIWSRYPVSRFWNAVDWCLQYSPHKIPRHAVCTRLRGFRPWRIQKGLQDFRTTRYTNSPDVHR